MTNFILIAICILAGILFRRSQFLPSDAHKGINAWILYIAMPAVSFKYLPHIQWSKELLLPALSPVVVWVCAWLIITFYCKKQHLDRATNGAMKIVTGLANTSFVGFPLIMAYFGEKEISIAIICDQVTFLLLSTVGIYTSIQASGNSSISISSIAKKLFLFPPFMAFIAAMVLPHFVDISPLNPLFDKLAGTVGPLALFSIGLQLQFSGWKEQWKHLSFALFYKLLLAPVLISVIAIALQIKGTIAQISIFEAAMPTMLTVTVLADTYNLNPKLSNLIVCISIVMSFVTTFLWWVFLTYSGLF